MTVEIMLCIVGVAMLATGALAFWIGYIFGWNDRGIHNRARRAGVEHAERQHAQWRTTLLDEHRREAEADRHWEKILHDWAAEDGRQSHIMELSAGAWPAEDIPATHPRLIRDHQIPPIPGMLESLPPDHVPEAGFLTTTPGTRIEIRAEEYITADGVNLGEICYRVDIDPDGTQYTPWDYDEDDLT